MSDDYTIVGWKVLGNHIYQPEEISSWWRNDRPLPYSFLHIPYSQWPFVDPSKHTDIMKENIIDAHQFPRDEFPLIEDFEVTLWATLFHGLREESQLLYEVRFLSPSCGLLAGLRDREYTAQELCRADFIIPCGDFTRPYFDFDQGWAVLIAEQDAFVYILTGSFEDLQAEKGYHTWFKVEKSRYLSQWEQAIQLARQWCAQHQRD